MRCRFGRRPCEAARLICFKVRRTPPTGRSITSRVTRSGIAAFPVADDERQLSSGGALEALDHLDLDRGRRYSRLA
jgi:hypothetical protein